MPIATQEQRRQAIDFGKIRGTGMPNPPLGLSNISARAHILNLYFEAAIPAPTFFWRNKNRLTGSWKSKTAPVSAWKSKVSSESLWQEKVTPQDGNTQTI